MVGLLASVFHHMNIEVHLPLSFPLHPLVVAAPPDKYGSSRRRLLLAKKAIGEQPVVKTIND